jgi:D-alanyl-D-alanine endopeptidase (penicillin-binding protein 7)
MKTIFGLILFVWVSATHAAPSIWLYNIDKGQVVIGNNINQSRPVASITKLMTVIVSMDNDSDLTKKIKVSTSNKLPNGMYTRQEVITAILVRSDNSAAETLARDFPGGRKEFIKAMNLKAQQIGMTATRFVDASGLSANNVSTALGISILLEESTKYPIIKETSIKKQAIFEHHYKTKIRKIQLENTNKPLLFEFDDIIVSKTGFTNAAGWNVGLVVQKSKHRFALVVLGAKSKQERYRIAKEILYNHLSDNELDEMVDRSYNKNIDNLY